MEDMQEICASVVAWDRLRGKTALITGANGLIASYLCYTLLYLNDTAGADITVLALVRNKEKARKQFGAICERPDFKLLVQDVCEPMEYGGEINFIIHAASQASPRHFLSDPVGTIAANTVGTKNILDLAVRKKSEEFLYLSTREIYGKSIGDKEFIMEDDYGTTDPTQVRSCYSESKRMSETLCAAYRHQYGVNAKVARIAHTYGPGMTIGDGRVMGDFLYSTIHGENIKMNSDGSGILGLTYLSDLIAGLYMLLLNFSDFVYNISNDEAIISVRELAEMLAVIRPEKHVDIEYAADHALRSGYLPHRVGLLSSGKAKENGWIPKIGIKEGFRRTIKTFLD
jgi:nucleoside-diphosphate-sugar epimerase